MDLESTGITVPIVEDRHPFMLIPWPLFTKPTDVLQQDLVKSRSRDIRVKTLPIALKLDRYLGSAAAEMPVKFQSDTIIITPNLTYLRPREILW